MRERILARRSALIAAALASACDRDCATKPSPCLSVAYVPEDGAAPRPCLEIMPAADAGIEQAGPEDASTDAPADADASVDALAPTKQQPQQRPKPAPGPCLTVPRRTF